MQIEEDNKSIISIDSPSLQHHQNHYNTISPFVDVKFYNHMPLDGTFMHCQFNHLPLGTEFTVMPFKFDDGCITDCLVINDNPYNKLLDKKSNPLYSVCILHSETFFKYFVPGIQYLGSKLTPPLEWKERWSCVKVIKGYFYDGLDTKNKFIDYCLDHSNPSIKRLIDDKSDTKEHVVLLNRIDLYYSSLTLLQQVINEFESLK